MAYRQARNCCTTKTRKAKGSFFLSTWDKPRLFWSNLKTCIGLGKQGQTSLFWPSSTPILSKTSANMLNNSFLARITSLQQPICSTTSHLETSAIIFHADSGVSSPGVSSLLAVNCNFSFMPVSQASVLKLINDLPLSGATGSDAISTRMLKFSAAEVSSILAKLFNISISTETFPSRWKTAVVTPIFKKGNRADISNYRPITILSSASKIFERLIDKQLRAFIEDNAILSRHQHGFRRHHSCQTALLSLTTNLFKNRQAKQHTVMVSPNYSKMFETLKHQILLNKLTTIGLSALSRFWFQSYLEDCRQLIKYNGALSDYELVPYWLSQGSSLSPTLFIIYINDLLLKLPDSTAMAYADDITLLTSGLIASDAQFSLQRLL